ncbi:MAG: hypothetical protein L6R38_007831 [Xanthoria sp. 2 TBL-2021]|nr:MAG: hypothetical protein L6R38_007831 [Xanthoria sp. 2 TBL-2021]
MAPNDAEIIIYGYVPSIALCALGIALFGLALGAHIYRVLRHRIWSFLPFSLACLMEMVGYIFRTLSSVKDPYMIPYFVVQYFFIVVAPVLISASIYVCLSKLIRWAANVGFETPSGFLLRPKLLLWVFITADVVTSIVQIAGAALIGVAESNKDSPVTANNILLAGLAVQTAAFMLFLYLYTTFVFQLGRDAGNRVQFGVIRPLLLAIGVASLLVLLRTVFRLAETSEGVFGYASSHESLFGSLEFAPIIAAVWILAIWHPGRWLPKTKGSSQGSMAPMETVHV